jgi:rhamnogalacturonyl hydrolase YesR
MEREHRQLIDRVAGATARYPFKVWGFGESIAMEGLLAAGGRHRRFAASLLTQWATTAPPLHTEPLAHVAPGVPLLSLLTETNDPGLRTRAAELADVMRTFAVGASGARIHRPDLSGWEHEVWVDCMHLDGPFLVRYGHMTGDDSAVDLGAELLLSHARVLQDETSGLFSHGFDDATGQRNHLHWGRGQGWALLGLADTLRELPAAHPARAEIQQRLTRLIDGLAATEAESGQWSTVVDHKETYREPSVSAFVALGVGRAVDAGLAELDRQALADRAWDAVATQLAGDGTLPGVSDATPVGATAAHYGSRPRGVFPWGQGPALLAAIERASPARSPSPAKA